MRVNVHSSSQEIDFSAPISRYLSGQPSNMLKQHWTVKEAVAYLHSSGKELHLRFFYVVNDDGQLQGVVSSHQLLFANQQQKLQEVMDNKPLTLTPADSVATAVEQLNAHRLVALPVIDDSRTLIGLSLIHI